jgi:hypothetical protein
MNGQKVTREIPGSLSMFHAADIEARLRDAGVPALAIPGIIGAAFIASLTDLPPGQRRRVLDAHLETVIGLMVELQHVPQAPDGPLPNLREVDAYMRRSRPRKG